MAGIKITDLSALSVAESGDYLCIVDVSDTSQSPEGTTKKIEVGNVGSTSGTWTPEFRGATGIADLTIGSGVATYFQIGDLVQGNFRFRGVVTNSISAQFFFTLPVIPATFSSNRKLSSTFGIYCEFADVQDFEVISLTGDVVAEVNINTLATITFDAVVTFNYLVA